MTINFGTAANRALSAAAASHKHSTSQNKTYSDEGERKRAFVQTFRRWEVLFKRADRGNVEADMWLIAEYFDSLGHLSPAQFDALTRELKARCTFFPTIRECLEIINPPPHSYSSPFYKPLSEYSSDRMASLPRSTQRALGYEGGAE